TLAAALASNKRLATLFPTSSLAPQLNQAANIIQALALGLARQIFLSQSAESTLTATPPRSNSPSLRSWPVHEHFYNATIERGVDSNITTCALSEFART